MATRRSFLRQSSAIGGGLALAGIGLGPNVVQARAAPGTPTHPLRILILGGTGFIGPHLISHALGRGHEISIFTRGQAKPTVHRDVYPHVERLIGERGADLGALEGRTWDAVIDNSGYNAEWTRDSARLLKKSVELYLYTSSTGVYYPYLGDDLTEETELVSVEPPGANEDSWYGVMKTLSERAALDEFGRDRTIVARPTYIVGPGDTSNRFPYWPARLARGGEVLVPGQPQDPVQFIDVRDLAAFMIHLVERRMTGTYNVAGPASRLGMHAFVHGAHAAVSSAVEWVPIPDYAFLAAHGVPYVVPWIMPTEDNYGSARVNNAKARAAGLTYHPLAATVADTLAWWQSEAISDERRARLETAADSLMVREAGIIAAWRTRK